LISSRVGRSSLVARSKQTPKTTRNPEIRGTKMPTQHAKTKCTPSYLAGTERDAATAMADVTDESPEVDAPRLHIHLPHLSFRRKSLENKAGNLNISMLAGTRKRRENNQEHDENGGQAKARHQNRRSANKHQNPPRLRHPTKSWGRACVEAMCTTKGEHARPEAETSEAAERYARSRDALPCGGGTRRPPLFNAKNQTPENGRKCQLNTPIFTARPTPARKRSFNAEAFACFFGAALRSPVLA